MLIQVEDDLLIPEHLIIKVERSQAKILTTYHDPQLEMKTVAIMEDISGDHWYKLTGELDEDTIDFDADM